MTNQSPKVFISYAHEGDISNQVKELADWLTGNGVTAITDHPYANRPPAQGWRSWMQHSIEDADVVLIVCTERYKKLFERRNDNLDGGFGVTWESAIVTNEIYQSRLSNNRFFPILPDSGNPEDIPAVLFDYNNNHRFPGGNDRILQLIKDDVVIPKPKCRFAKQLAGELRVDDNRLMSREREVIGRKDEIDKVIAFLNSSAAGEVHSAQVVGMPGVGKTEVCKAALKLWLGGHGTMRCFWISVNDECDRTRFLVHLIRAVELDVELVQKNADISLIGSLMPRGIYYLDNAESLLESTDGRTLLRELMQFSQMRLLVSTRVANEYLFGSSISVNCFSDSKAIELFYLCWNGASRPDNYQLQWFLSNKIGGHALSVALLARLGRYYSWENIQQLWIDKGTEIAASRQADTRLDSLNVSLNLTFDLIKRTPGACMLWQFAALFDDGLEENALENWISISKSVQPEKVLLDHHILSLSEQRIYRMLSPLRRFARSENPRFDWASNRELFYDFFINISSGASLTDSTNKKICSSEKISKYLWAMVNLIDMDKENPDKVRIRILNRQLSNVFNLNVLAGKAWLEISTKLLGDGLSSHFLGMLESRLGKIEKARAHFEQADMLYESENNEIGQANVSVSFGELNLKIGRVLDARENFKNAIKLYQKHQDQVGLANASLSLGALNFNLGYIEHARTLYDRAIEIYRNNKVMLGLANVLRFSGDLEKRVGNLDKARENYIEAKELSERLQANLILANVLLSLGNLESYSGNVELARGCYESAIELYRQEHDNLGCANVLKSIGHLAFADEDFKSARDHYENALTLFQNEQNSLGCANVLKAIGDLDVADERMESAQINYERSIELFHAVDNPLGKANVLFSLGKLNQLYEQYTQALRYFKRAADIYENVQDYMGLSKVFSEIMVCRAKRENSSDLDIANLFERALLAARLSNSESVGGYLFDALIRACSCDEVRAERIRSILGGEDRAEVHS